MQSKKYYLAAFTAFLLWGFFSLALKPLANYPSIDILFYRISAAVVLITGINLIFRQQKLKENVFLFKSLPKSEKLSIVKLSVLGGGLLLFNRFIFIYILNHISIKAASFGYLICPIVTTILAFIILKEGLNKWQKASVVISIIACLILGFQSLKDIVYSLMIAVSYALYLISQRKNKKLDSFISLNIQMLVMFLVLVPFYPAYAGAIPTEPLFYICLFFIVVFFTVIPLFLNLFALSGVSSSSVGIMLYLNPILNFLIAIFYFKESVTTLQLLGYTIIFCSVLIFNKEVLFGTSKPKIQNN